MCPVQKKNLPQIHTCSGSRSPLGGGGVHAQTLTAPAWVGGATALVQSWAGLVHEGTLWRCTLWLWPWLWTSSTVLAWAPSLAAQRGRVGYIVDRILHFRQLPQSQQITVEEQTGGWVGCGGGTFKPVRSQAGLRRPFPFCSVVLLIPAARCPARPGGRGQSIVCCTPAGHSRVAVAFSALTPSQTTGETWAASSDRRESSD